MGRVSSSKYMVNAGWNDVPHLSDAAKAELLESTPPHLRDARTKGTPSLGSGAIYPIPLDEVTCTPFAIPHFWKRGFALDVGWNRTAAIWGAQDPADGVLYAYAEHYMGQAIPTIHATSIKARGDWIKGAIDPAARGRSQSDGEQLIVTYRGLNLKLTPAINAVEPGLYEVWTLLSTGRLRLFSTLMHTQAEYRLYRRDEKGKVVKKNDHCLHGDTEVLTRQGPKRIADMVGTTGEVLSIGGKWQAYQHCRMTGQNKETIIVSFEDGSTVRCTPDHRFLTQNGWVQALDLEGESVYDAVSERIKDNSRCRSRSSPRHAKNIVAAATTFVANTFSAMVSACTGAFGPTRMGQFPMGIMSTTLMRTSITTPSTTSNCLSNQSTCPYITKAMPERLPTPLERPQLNGTARMRGVRGTKTIIKIPKESCIAASESHVTSVVRDSMGSMVKAAASVQTSARPSFGLSLALMTRHVSAWFAGLISPSTNTEQPRHAAGHAVLRCNSVSASEPADVYCLEVPGNHAFAVNNGVIVHNCMDALRYLVMTWSRISSVKPAAQHVHEQTLISDTRAGY